MIDKDKFLAALDHDPPWDVLSDFSLEEIEELFRLAKVGVNYDVDLLNDSFKIIRQSQEHIQEYLDVLQNRLYKAKAVADLVLEAYSNSGFYLRNDLYSPFMNQKLISALEEYEKTKL